MGVQIQEIQIDGLKSQLNDKQMNNTGNIFLMTIMHHLWSFDKGAFLLKREGVTSANYIWINITPKITKIQELPGSPPPWPPPGRTCPGPTGGLKAVPRPHAFEKNSRPLTRIPGSAPAQGP